MGHSRAFAVAGLLLLGATVHAHPGHDHTADLRVWKGVDGLFEIEASFVMVRGCQVHLCQHDDTVVRVPLEKLSRNDREWVQHRVGEIHGLNSPIDSKPMKKVVLQASQPVMHEGRSSASSAIVAGCIIVLFSILGLLVHRKAKALPVVLGPLVLLSPLMVIEARAEGEKQVPAIQKHFEPFKDKLELRSDADYLYVGSNGLPDHPMMIGIKSWQQQVPLPQPYTGKNAWQLPLKPRLADKPISAKTALFSGAIALAVNGVPIFNALNNRGEDAFLAGELDEYGGHCGRGDDYHYHAAPVHLEKVVGKGQPIAFALDGFPLHGYTAVDGKAPQDLDEFNGRMEKDGYRYYSTRKYPYINGGIRGVVTVRGDRIIPQPRDMPIRPAGRPLRGAKITGFTQNEEKKTTTLEYEVQGKSLSVKYTLNNDNTYTFVYTDGDGKAATETYRHREGKDGPRPKKDEPPPKDDPSPTKSGSSDKFELTSPAFEPGGTIPMEYTGDGAGVSPPLAWIGAPIGTKSYALQVWHKAFPDRNEVKSYWVITHIPASVTRLDKNTRGVGRAGYNDKNRTDYDPMKSKGPGAKEYHITIYALSAEPKFAGEKVARADLLRAIKDITLAESTLSYKYERVVK